MPEVNAEKIDQKPSVNIGLEVYKDLIDHSTEGIFLAQHGRIIECNRTGADMLGYRQDEIIGMSPLDISPEYQPDGRISAEVFEGIIKSVLSGNPQLVEWTHLRKDGTDLITEVSISLLEYGKTSLMLAILRDISKRKRNENIQQVQFQIAEATSRTKNLTDLLREIHQQLGTLIDVRNFYVALYHPESETYTLPYEVDEQEEWDPEAHHRLEFSLTDYVRKKGESIYADDEVWNSLLDSGEVKLVGEPSKMWLGAPLRTSRGVIGVVAVQSYDRDDLYNRQDLELLEFVAEHAAIAIERKRAHDALIESEYSFRFLFEESPIGVVACNNEMAITQCNEQFAKIFRSSKDKLLGLNLNLIKNDEIISAVKRALDGNKSTYEGYYKTFSGAEIWVNLYGTPLYDMDKKITGAMAVVEDITERIESEKEIRVQKAYFEHLVEAAPEVIVIVDKEDRVVRVNRQFTRVFGFTPDEVIGKTNDLIVPEYLKEEGRELGRRALEEKSIRHSTKRQTKEGYLFDVTILGTPVVIDGTRRGTYWAYIDDSERTKAEENLRVQKAYLEELFEGAPEAIAILDNEDKCLRVNRDFTRMFGYTSDEVIGRAINELIVPEDLFDEGLEATTRVTLGHQINMETVRQAKDGKRIHVSILGKPVVLDQNQIAVYGIYRDITKRKQAEKALRESEEQLRTVIDSVDAALWSADVDPETRKYSYTLILGNIEKISGYKAEEFVSRKESFWNEIFHPEDAHKIKPLDDELFSGNSASCEYRIFHKNGGIRWLIDVATPIKDENGKVTNINGITFDVTEMRIAQEELAAEKERLAVTLRSIHDAVISTDTEGTVILLNSKAEQLTGWSQEEAIGKPLMDIFNLASDTKNPVRINPAREIFETSGITGLTHEGILSDRRGNTYVVAESAAPIRDRISKIVGVVIAFRDVSQQKKMEQELLRAQKLESLGILAGGIAHDFNNILTAIIANISLARLSSTSREKVTEKLLDAEKALLRAKDLTQQLLTFSKGGAPIKKVASMEDILRQTAEFALHGSSIQCNISISEKLKASEVDEGQISQVLHNLLINASQAMPTGGEIQIIAENETINNYPGIPLERGEYLKIRVIDNGTGIPEEFIEKIFDPYFTTKQAGSGLGLASCFSIVTNHDGYITVDSEVGKGTNFTIYLPASEAEITPETEDVEDSISGKGSILVMDDEEPLLEVINEMLSFIGYEVKTVQNGEDAIKEYFKAKENGTPFDVLIMDLTVPGGMGGKETLEKIMEKDPDVSAIVSSGYSNDPVMANFKKYGFKGVVAKPYRVEELNKTLQQIMNE